jgi:hypothetical protein
VGIAIPRPGIDTGMGSSCEKRFFKVDIQLVDIPLYSTESLLYAVDPRFYDVELCLSLNPNIVEF